MVIDVVIAAIGIAAAIPIALNRDAVREIKTLASGSTNLPGPEAMARAIAWVFACSL